MQNLIDRGRLLLGFTEELVRNENFRGLVFCWAAIAIGYFFLSSRALSASDRFLVRFVFRCLAAVIATMALAMSYHALIGFGGAV